MPAAWPGRPHGNRPEQGTGWPRSAYQSLDSSPGDQCVGWSCSRVPTGGLGEDVEEREAWSCEEGGRQPVRFEECSEVQGAAGAGASHALAP